LNRRPLTPSEVARKKKRIINPDKSVSTERSITIGVDGGFINIPTIVNGKQLSPEDAIAASKKSGVVREMYKTQDEAVAAAKRRSEAIGRALR